MKERVAAFLVPVWLCAFAGCATELTAAGQGVRFGKMEPSGACRELGHVLGSGGGGGYTSSADKMQWAENELRNRAAEMGGNYVVLDAAGGDVGGLTLSGRAYQCPSGGVASEGAVAAPTQRPQLAPSAPPVLSPEERIARLRGLLDKGVITQQEYDSRRREILQSL